MTSLAREIAAAVARRAGESKSMPFGVALRHQDSRTVPRKLVECLCDKQRHFWLSHFDPNGDIRLRATGRPDYIGPNQTSFKSSEVRRNFRRASDTNRKRHMTARSRAKAEFHFLIADLLRNARHFLGDERMHKCGYSQRPVAVAHDGHQAGGRCEPHTNLWHYGRNQAIA
ncbi:hypothetical protein J7E49_00305 [Variovorax paradoxus]|nr:hypothetical protein [Variovorax paradoxus]